MFGEMNRRIELFQLYRALALWSCSPAALSLLRGFLVLIAGNVVVVPAQTTQSGQRSTVRWTC